MVHAPLEDEARISRDFQFQPRLSAGGYACRPLVSSSARPHARTRWQPRRVSGFPHALERRRPRHFHPPHRKSRVRKAAV